MEKELKTTWKWEVCNYVSAKPGITRTPASSVIIQISGSPNNTPFSTTRPAGKPPTPPSLPGQQKAGSSKCLLRTRGSPNGRPGLLSHLCVEAHSGPTAPNATPASPPNPRPRSAPEGPSWAPTLLGAPTPQHGALTWRLPGSGPLTPTRLTASKVDINGVHQYDSSPGHSLPWTHTHTLTRLGTATWLALAKEMCTKVTHVTPK